MIRSFLLKVILLAVLIITGCKSKPAKDYGHQLPPGRVALEKITDPAKIPDFTWACSNLKDLEIAINNSLDYYNHQSSQAYFPYLDITHERAVASLKAFKDLFQMNLSADELNRIIRERFDVYRSVGCDGLGTVLFTGYYSPIFDGSLTQTGLYQYPLYKQPPDLIKGPDGTILAPYPPRSQLESSGKLKGLELIWLKDPFEVYVAHVQGSALIRLPDGKMVTVGYAANNGQDYKSIGLELVKDGKLSAKELSLARMIEYFQQHPGDVVTYVNRNPRFVFFQLGEGRPRGSLNTPVIPYRSIATDKAVYPRGGLAYIKTHLPTLNGYRISEQPYGGFALDQDTGGAIRAPGRCDVYMGQGALAGRLAGHTYREGNIYYLFVKE